MITPLPNIRLHPREILSAVSDQYPGDGQIKKEVGDTVRTLLHNFGKQQPRLSFTNGEVQGLENVLLCKSERVPELHKVLKLIQGMAEKEAEIDWNKLTTYYQMKQAGEAHLRGESATAAAFMKASFEDSEEIAKFIRLAKGYLNKNQREYTDNFGNEFSLDHTPVGERSYTVTNKEKNSWINIVIDQEELLQEVELYRKPTHRYEHNGSRSLYAYLNDEKTQYNLELKKYSENIPQTIVAGDSSCTASFPMLQQAVDEEFNSQKVSNR